MQAVSKGLDGLKQLLGEPREVAVGGADGIPPLSAWNNTFRVSQARGPSPTRCMGWMYKVSQVHQPFPYEVHGVGCAYTCMSPAWILMGPYAGR